MRAESTRNPDEGALGAQRLRHLVSVGRSLVSELQLDVVLDRILAGACEVTGARYAAVGVLDEGRHELARFVSRGSTARLLARSAIFPVAVGSWTLSSPTPGRFASTTSGATPASPDSLPGTPSSVCPSWCFHWPARWWRPAACSFCSRTAMIWWSRQTTPAWLTTVRCVCRSPGRRRGGAPDRCPTVGRAGRGADVLRTQNVGGSRWARGRDARGYRGHQRSEEVGSPHDRRPGAGRPRFASAARRRAGRRRGDGLDERGPGVILVCFDGSADAEAAVDRAASLMPGGPGDGPTVWEPFIDVMARSGGLTWSGGFMPEVDQIDKASRDRAGELAQQGVDRARGAGLAASPLVGERSISLTAAILSAAAEVQAEAIVLGSRGLTGVKSVLLGSVSHAVLQHADRPVLVVPSAEVAEARSRPTRST